MAEKCRRMTQWEVSGCPDAKARQPNGYFSPLACGVLPQPSRHGEQNTRDGEKRRAGKPADAVRQDVEDDGDADDRRGEQQRGQSEQEARRKYFLARVTKQEQPIAFCESCMALVATAQNRQAPAPQERAMTAPRFDQSRRAVQQWSPAAQAGQKVSFP